MSNQNFCSNCGKKRLAEAKFCFHCGHAYGSADRAPVSWTTLVLAGGLVVVVVLVAVLLTRGEKSDPPGRTQTAADHDHVHEEPPFLLDLKEKAKSGEPKAMIDLAEHQLALGSRDKDYFFQAAQTLEAFLERFPDHAYALRHLGNAFYNLGIPEKAIPAYQAYLTQFPNDANVHTDLGTQFLAMNRPREAIEQYNKAIAIFPNFYNAHFNLSVAYQKIGDEASADRYREEAKQIEATHGKHLAPAMDVPRLPTRAGIASEAASSSEPAGGGDSRFATLERFFREHEIIAPKMTSFEVSQELGVLYVREFPMEAMPPFVRESLDKKIEERLVEAGEGARLEIRDADSDQVLAEYGGK